MTALARAFGLQVAWRWRFRPPRAAVCAAFSLAALHVFLRLGAPSGLEVQVLDPAGQPVQEAVLDVMPVQCGGEIREIDTDGGRGFLPWPGRFLLTVRAVGFVPWTGEVDAPGEMLTVRLTPGTGVMGRVTDDDGNPVRGARLALEAEGKAAAPSLIASDADGYFYVEGLEAGSYTLRAEGAGHIPRARKGISLTSGRIESVAVVLSRAADLRLAVSGEKKEPLSGAVVSVVTSGTAGLRLPDGERERLAALSWETGPDGTALVGPLPVGLRLRLAVRGDRYAPQSIELALREPREARSVELRRGGALRLLATDTEGAPVPGATVQLSSPDARDADLLAEKPPAGEDGRVVLDGLPEGSYTLVVRAEGFRPEIVKGLKLTLAADRVLGVELQRGTTLVGRVVSESGAPLAGAKVTATFAQGGSELRQEAVAGEDGAFRLDGLPDGAVRIHVERQGYEDGGLAGVTPGVGDVEVRLAVDPSAYLCGGPAPESQVAAARP